MELVSFNRSNYPNLYKSSSPNFRGDIGRKIVGRLKQGEVVIPKEVVGEVKNRFFGLDEKKVEDVFEELRSSVSNEIGLHKYYTKEIETKTNQIETALKENEQAVKDTRESTTDAIKTRMKQQETHISQNEKEIIELNEFSSKYKDLTCISYDEARVLSPQEAIDTMISMSEGVKEAHEDMLNFLFTGKGGQKAVKRANQGVELWKSHSDGVFRIPDVEKVSKETKGYCSGSASTTLLNTMKAVLTVNPKGSYICAGPIRKQVTKNAVAILNPLYKDPKAAEKDVEKMLNEVSEIRNGLARAKENKLKDHDGWTYTFEPNDYYNAVVTEYKNGVENNSWNYCSAAYVK